METVLGANQSRRRGRLPRHQNETEIPVEDLEMSEAVETVAASELETLQLSSDTLLWVDCLREFYKNNRDTDVTRDAAITFAAKIALSYGQSVTKTADGHVQRVRG